MPAYYVMLTAVACRYGLKGDLLWAATYTSNWYYALAAATLPLYHIWSLAVEEQFYLFWPLFIESVSSGRALRLVSRYIIPGALAGATLVALLLPTSNSAWAIYSLTPFRLPSLSLGAYVALREGPIRRNRYLSNRLMLSLVAASCLIMLTQRLLIPHSRFVPVFGMAYYTALSASILLAAVCSDKSGTATERILTFGPLRRIGRISYGVYLWHLPIYVGFGVFMTRVEQNRLILAPAALATTFTVATLSYFLWERPLMTVGQRLASNQRLAAEFGGTPLKPLED